MNTEKAKLIEQLRTLYRPLSEIDALNSDRSQAERDLETCKEELDYVNSTRDKYDLSKVKVSLLPVSNEAQLRDTLDARHRRTKAEQIKRKASGFIVMIVIVAVIAIVAAAVANILAYNDNPEGYVKKFTLLSQSNSDTVEVVEGEKIKEYPIHYAFIVIDALMFVMLAVTFVKSLRKRVGEVMTSAGVYTGSTQNKSFLSSVGGKLGGFYEKFITVIMTICGIVLLALETPLVLVFLVPLFALYFYGKGKISSNEVDRFTYTYSERDELAAAKALDEKNSKENQKRSSDATQKEKARQRAAWEKEHAAATDAYVKSERAVKVYDDKIAEIRKTLPTGLLAAKDMNSSAVGSLIGYLETGRADTLKEALTCLDAQRAEEARTASLLRQQQFQHDLDRQMDDWKRQDDRRRYENDMRDLRDRLDSQHRQRQNELERHNREVERELEKLTKP